MSWNVAVEREDAAHGLVAEIGRGPNRRIAGLLTSEGWAHAPELGEDGYTGYERGGVRLELAFLERGDDGTVYTPLEDGRGAWPEDAFGDDVAKCKVFVRW